MPPEHTYSTILKVTGQVWEAKKGWASTLIAATTSVHLPKPVSTDLTIKPDSVLTNPIYKSDVKPIIHFFFQQLKEARATSK